jgi:hypothetical protein
MIDPRYGVPQHRSLLSKVMDEARAEYEARHRKMQEWSRIEAEQMAESTAWFRQHAPNVLRQMLAKGWYPSMSMSRPLVRHLGDLLQAGRHREFESVMTEFARGLVDGTEEALAASWPARADVLRAAFSAHCNGQFALSVPVMLSQADGIDGEIFGEADRLFSRREYKVAIPRAAFEGLTFEGAPMSLGLIGEWFLLPVTEKPAMGLRSDDWSGARTADPFSNPLNRHAVLHGLDTAYATEGNSLRAVLLLDYLVGMKDRLERRVKLHGVVNGKLEPEAMFE